MLRSGYLALALLAGMATQVAHAQAVDDYPSELYQVVMQCRDNNGGQGNVAVNYCALTGEITANGLSSPVDAARAYGALVASSQRFVCTFRGPPVKIGGTEWCPPGETAFRGWYFAQ
jgi:hypothetical protein